MHEGKAGLARRVELVGADLEQGFGVAAIEVPVDVVAQRLVERGVELAGRAGKPRAGAAACDLAEQVRAVVDAVDGLARVELDAREAARGVVEALFPPAGGLDERGSVVVFTYRSDRAFSQHLPY